MAVFPYTTWAIDFDGYLCKCNYPNIGAPNIATIEFFKDRKKQGDKLILWTCRSGERLEEAIRWCEKHDLEFDSVNENLPEWIGLYGNDSRKIGADYYCDDKNFTMWNITSNVYSKEKKEE